VCVQGGGLLGVPCVRVIAALRILNQALEAPSLLFDVADLEADCCCFHCCPDLCETP
jgi:hypothetical protein